MNDMIQCREAPPCLSRPNGMCGELQSEYRNGPQDTTVDTNESEVFECDWNMIEKEGI